MGGQKKKAITKSDKKKKPEPIKIEKKGKLRNIDLKAKIDVPKMDAAEAAKTFVPMKAITIYSTAKSLGINASLANKLLKDLESKKILEKVGGYSGHYVYKFVKSEI